MIKMVKLIEKEGRKRELNFPRKVKRTDLICPKIQEFMKNVIFENGAKGIYWSHTHSLKLIFLLSIMGFKHFQNRK